MFHARASPRRRSLLTAAALIAATGILAPLAVGDQGPAVSGSTAYNSERKVATAPNGTLFVTYVDTVNNTSTVLVKQSADGGASWKRLPPVSSREAFRSAVAVDIGGRVHVAWSQFVGSDRQVFYARWEGGPAWVDSEQLSHTIGYSGFPSIAVDSGGRVHLVWYGFDGTNYQVFYTWRQGADPWAAAVQATHGAKDANAPAIAVGPGDRVHVTYFTYVRGETDVWYMLGGPDGWSAPERVNRAGESSVRPSLVVLGNGSAGVAWVVLGNSTSEVHYAERGSPAGWSPSFAVSGGDAGADNPSLSASPDGDVAVFYETGPGAIRSATRIRGSWHVPTTLAVAPGNQWPSSSWASDRPPINASTVAVVWTFETNATSQLRFALVEVFPPSARPPTVAPDPYAGARMALVASVGAGAAILVILVWPRIRRGG